MIRRTPREISRSGRSAALAVAVVVVLGAVVAGAAAEGFILASRSAPPPPGGADGFNPAGILVLVGWGLLGAVAGVLVAAAVASLLVVCVMAIRYRSRRRKLPRTPDADPDNK